MLRSWKAGIILDTRRGQHLELDFGEGGQPIRGRQGLPSIGFLRVAHRWVSVEC